MLLELLPYLSIVKSSVCHLSQAVVIKKKKDWHPFAPTSYSAAVISLSMVKLFSPLCRISILSGDNKRIPFPQPCHTLLVGKFYSRSSKLVILGYDHPCVSLLIEWRFHTGKGMPNKTGPPVIQSLLT
jgi:hypothetical protein